MKRHLLLATMAVCALAATPLAQAEAPFVSGHVFMPDGTPAIDATVVFNGGGMYGTYWTDSEGFYKSDETPENPTTVAFKVSAWDADYTYFYQRSDVTFPLEEGNVFNIYLLTSEENCALGITVTDGSSLLQGATVTTNKSDQTYTTDDAGLAVIELTPDNTADIEVSVSMDGYTSVTQLVEWPADSKYADVTVTLQSEEGDGPFVSGYIQLPDGSPAVDATIVFNDGNGYYGTFWTDGNGYYESDESPADYSVPFRITAFLDNYEYSAKDVTFPKATGNKYNVRFKEAARQVAFDVASAEYLYNGSVGDGLGMYQLLLGEMTIKNAQYNDEGYFMQMCLIAPEPEDPEHPALPEGTFLPFDASSDAAPVAGTYVLQTSKFSEIFYNEDFDMFDEMAYEIQGGDFTVSMVDGAYVLSSNIEATYEDWMTSEVDNVVVNVAYTGNPTFYNPEAYHPLGEDVNVTDVNLSGLVTPTGMWNLLFYNAPLDDDNFVIGAGDLLNIYVYVPAEEQMTGEALCDIEFTAIDAFATTRDEWNEHFVQGYWQNQGYGYMATGTNLTITDEEGFDDRVGLATGGTIVFTRTAEANVYHMSANLETPEGDKITCEWEGKLADYIQGCTEYSGIADIEETEAPVEYYTLQGVRIDNPAKGQIVIKRQGSRAQRVMMR